jgi:hypothetical protein
MIVNDGGERKRVRSTLKTGHRSATKNGTYVCNKCGLSDEVKAKCQNGEHTEFCPKKPFSCGRLPKDNCTEYRIVPNGDEKINMKLKLKNGSWVIVYGEC